MDRPELVALGYRSATAVRILIVADSEEGVNYRFARIATKAAGAVNHQDINLQPLDPYVRGLADITALPEGEEVAYAIQIAEKSEDLASADDILAEEDVDQFKLPPTDRPLRVGLLSCNRTTIYADQTKQFELWEKLSDTITDAEDPLMHSGFGPDIVIHAGDQIYSDDDYNIPQDYLTALHLARSHRRNRRFPEPTELWLLKRYRKAYFTTWTKDSVSKVLRSRPSVMMWDDHDIINGWGVDSHVDEHEQRFFEAAKQTFKEFQQPLNPDLELGETFTVGFTHGDVGALLLDTRTKRDYDKGKILGDSQFPEIQKWLEDNQGLRTIYVVQPKPIVFGDMPAHPSFLIALAGKSGDMQEFWNAPENQNELARLLMIFFNAMKADSDCQICVLSGDLHCAYIGEITSHLQQHTQANRQARIPEIVSSGIGNKAPSGLIGKAGIMKAIDEEKTINLVDNSIVGDILSLEHHEKLANNKILLERNFAIISLENAAHTARDTNNNIWVTYYTPTTKIHKCIFGVPSQVS